MELKWTILFFLGAMLSFCIGLNWMAGGTFTQANFDTLRTKVDAFDKTLGSSALSSSATTMSNELNTLWQPAWNVIIVYESFGMNLDSVMYGYAFNGQWFWQNGIQLINNNYIAFIIWKDFNCVQWFTYNPQDNPFLPSSGTTYAGEIISNLQASSTFPARNTNDIWKAAQDLLEFVSPSDDNLFQEKTAYTIIAAPVNSSYFFGRFCASFYVTASNVFNSGPATGKALILQNEVIMIIDIPIIINLHNMKQFAIVKQYFCKKIF